MLLSAYLALGVSLACLDNVGAACGKQLETVRLAAILYLTHRYIF